MYIFKMNLPFLSVIIPCYNSKPYITRLLDSIIILDILEKVEIIIVDDLSSEPFIDLLTPYYEKLNIKYFTTDTNVHCPGNSRQCGLDNATGEWIVFIDHDDLFYPDAFYHIYNIVELHPTIKTYISTPFYEISETDCETILNGPYEGINWLHGKVYNNAFLKLYNIQFKKDLVGYEDVYFNNLIYINTKINNLPYVTVYNALLYKWILNEKSFSRDNNLGYRMKFINDYFVSNYDIFCNYYLQTKNPLLYTDAKDYGITCILITYLWFLTAVSNNYKDIDKSYDTIKKWAEHLMSNLNINKDTIINNVYNTPLAFLKNFVNAGEKTIPTVSFKSFVLGL